MWKIESLLNPKRVSSPNLGDTKHEFLEENDETEELGTGNEGPEYGLNPEVKLRLIEDIDKIFESVSSVTT
jgi:hypothetical protein